VSAKTLAAPGVVVAALLAGATRTGCAWVRERLLEFRHTQLNKQQVSVAEGWWAVPCEGGPGQGGVPVNCVRGAPSLRCEGKNRYEFFDSRSQGMQHREFGGAV
jgi:hypothetical protein